MNHRELITENNRKRKNYLKQRRIFLNMTQKEVSSLSGVSLRTYQAYEQDIRLPNVETAIKIARVLRSDSESLWRISQNDGFLDNKTWTHIENFWPKDIKKRKF